MGNIQIIGIITILIIVSSYFAVGYLQGEKLRYKSRGRFTLILRYKQKKGDILYGVRKKHFKVVKVSRIYFGKNKWCYKTIGEPVDQTDYLF